MSSSTPCSISPTTTALDKPEIREISPTMGESSIGLGLELESCIKMLRWGPAAEPNTEVPTSDSAPALQSSEREKAGGPNPEVAAGADVISRELRWFREVGQVEIRGRARSAGPGVEEGCVCTEAVEPAESTPRLAFWGVLTPGARFKFKLRCTLMFKSSPVAEGRLPRLIEFLVAFFPEALRLTLAELPSSDLHGVTLPPGNVEGVLRRSKADNDWVEP